MSNSEDNKAGETPEMPPAGAAETVQATNEQVAALAAAVDELRDKFLRAVAETDNVRKRAERDVAEARAFGIANFARDAIGVADNLARALDAIGPEARAGANETLKALLDGVELTRREMRNTLKKHGVRELDPRGEKFDPNFHQAMYEVPDPEAAAGTVVEVMQTGYAIGDRVLRPALVAVAKASEKPSAKQDGAKAPGPGAS